MYQVEFSKKAIKSLQTFPKQYQIKIQQTIKKLIEDPFTLDIKKIDYSYATHRLRVGDYRIFLNIDLTSKKIIIAKMERRTTQTYR